MRDANDVYLLPKDIIINGIAGNNIAGYRVEKLFMCNKKKSD